MREQQLRTDVADFHGDVLWAYPNTRRPNRIQFEAQSVDEEFLFDIALEEALRLRDWLNRVLPVEPLSDTQESQS